jgi:hypothetical protein
LEEVLIILQGVHQDIPELKTAAAPVYLAPPAPTEEHTGSPQAALPANPNHAPVLTTEADKIREHYQEIGAAQGHKFGENLPGSKPADFNLQVKPGENLPAAAKPGLEKEKKRSGEAGTAPPGPAASPGRGSPAEPKAPAPTSQPKTVQDSKPAAPPQ